MTLLELQRRMASDVCRPLTSDFKMQSLTEDGQSLGTLANSYIAPSATLSSFERLEIYNRQYWLRVLGAVAEDYPALQALLGEQRFDALVLAYLQATHSTSWNLRDLSGKLPDFLAAHPQLAGRKHRLAVDVARLEWAYIEAFDGLAHDALEPDDLGPLGPQSTLVLQPHLRLLALEYPADELVLSYAKGSLRRRWSAAPPCPVTEFRLLLPRLSGEHASTLPRIDATIRCTTGGWNGSGS